MVAAAQREGQLASSASPEDIAALLFFVFEGSVRYWMHEEQPEVEAGIATLRRRLEMQLRAFVPERLPGRGATQRPAQPQARSRRLISTRRRWPTERSREDEGEARDHDGLCRRPDRRRQPAGRRSQRFGSGPSHTGSGRGPLAAAARLRLALRAGRRPDRRGRAGLDRGPLDAGGPAAHLERPGRGQHRRQGPLQARPRLVPSRLRRPVLRPPPLAAVRRSQHRRRRLAERAPARPAPGRLHGLPLRRDRRPHASRQRAAGEDGQQRAEDSLRPHGHRPAQRRLQHVGRALPDGAPRLDQVGRARGARRPRRVRRLRPHHQHRGACDRRGARKAGERRARGGHLRRARGAARRGRKGGRRGAPPGDARRQGHGGSRAGTDRRGPAPLAGAARPVPVHAAGRGARLPWRRRRPR